MHHADFLVEIQTEELPPKVLTHLAKSFAHEMREQLQKQELHFAESLWYATPRRLAVVIKHLVSQQPDTIIERKGPSVAAAFDKAGKPTPACLGFARSSGIPVEELQTLKTEQGEWLIYRQASSGKSVKTLLPDIVNQALQKLPIPKRMRWGNHSAEFVRPIHSIMLLYGDELIETTLMGLRTTNTTRGHRFLSTDKIKILNAENYIPALKKQGFVIADFLERKNLIRQQIIDIAKRNLSSDAHPVIQETLLEEVTGLVEWPSAIIGKFSKNFLTVPQEVLISAMQDHQRYFPVVLNDNTLLPYFIAITNLPSRDVARVVAGNERVLQARLSDAAFFFEQDKKHSLESRLPKLKNIIFQSKLGTLYDKTQRILKLAAFIAKKLNVDSEDTERASLLAKTDLTTLMVGEFPELQGIMGYYYALNDGENSIVATSIAEQYQPRFSKDQLPTTPLGNVLALADRLDTLVGVFGIHNSPSGDKDPFGLRRAAIGILRILIEKKLNLDLVELLQVAYDGYDATLPNTESILQVFSFIQERLKPWYQDQGISADVIASVISLNLTKPYDIHCRIQAVSSFKKLPEAESLSIANKRVSNILSKSGNSIVASEINETLFENETERELLQKIAEQQTKIDLLAEQAHYEEVLTQLATLREPVDNFFEHVMVMTEDTQKRDNRLLLLKKLRALFLQVADIALLQP